MVSTLLNLKTPLISAIGAVEAVLAVEKARQRKPAEYAHLTFFSDYDSWLYEAVADARVCPECRENEEIEMFPGSWLRTYFPYLEIEDENTISANCHPNCRCYLTRLIGSHTKV